MPEPAFSFDAGTMVAASAPVAFLSAPPVPALPVPVTVRPAVAPVLLRTIPLAGPEPAEVPVPAEMLLNVRPLAPILVLITLSAVPVVEERMFGDVEELL